MHQKIAGCITVESLPVLPGSPYVYHFDAEGIAVEPLTIIHQGILNHWFVGTKYAKKLNVIPCGQSQQRNIRVTGVYNADLEIQACVEITFLK
jgi:predicted Zn-dependent protease